MATRIPPPQSTDPRPDLGAALDRLVRDLCSRSGELGHVNPTAVLILAGGAKGTSRATIRSLRPPHAPTVTRRGRRVDYEVLLRPLFFLNANGLGRLCTLVHELMHIHPAAGGELDPERRHGAARAGFDPQALALARAYAAAAPPRLLEPLGHHGEALMPQWRVSPPSHDDGKHYRDTHLFLGPVVMHTPRAQRTVWW